MIKKLLSKISVVFLAVYPGLTGYSMLFSLVAAPQVHATVNDYWDEPLAVADNSCVLIPLNEGSGTTFYGQDTNSLYAFSGSFRSSGSAAWISAVHGNGLSFDGDSDQGVNVAQNGVLSLTDEDATWEFWAFASWFLMDWRQTGSVVDQPLPAAKNGMSCSTAHTAASSFLTLAHNR